MFNEERLKNSCNNILTKLRMLIQEAELMKLTDSQWWIQFEDELNELSIKDHNADQNS